MAIWALSSDSPPLLVLPAAEMLPAPPPESFDPIALAGTMLWIADTGSHIVLVSPSGTPSVWDGSEWTVFDAQSLSLHLTASISSLTCVFASTPASGFFARLTRVVADVSPAFVVHDLHISFGDSITPTKSVLVIHDPPNEPTNSDALYLPGQASASAGAAGFDPLTAASATGTRQPPNTSVPLSPSRRQSSPQLLISWDPSASVLAIILNTARLRHTKIIWLSGSRLTTLRHNLGEAMIDQASLPGESTDPGHWFSSMAWSPDGAVLAATTYKGTLFLLPRLAAPVPLSVDSALAPVPVGKPGKPPTPKDLVRAQRWSVAWLPSTASNETVNPTPTLAHSDGYAAVLFTMPSELASVTGWTKSLLSNPSELDVQALSSAWRAVLSSQQDTELAGTMLAPVTSSALVALSGSKDSLSLVLPLLSGVLRTTPWSSGPGGAPLPVDALKEVVQTAFDALLAARSVHWAFHALLLGESLLHAAAVADGSVSESPLWPSLLEQAYNESFRDDTQDDDDLIQDAAALQGPAQVFWGGRAGGMQGHVVTQKLESGIVFLSRWQMLCRVLFGRMNAVLSEADGDEALPSSSVHALARLRSVIELITTRLSPDALVPVKARPLQDKSSDPWAAATTKPPPPHSTTSPAAMSAFLVRADLERALDYAALHLATKQEGSEAPNPVLSPREALESTIRPAHTLDSSVASEVLRRIGSVMAAYFMTAEEDGDPTIWIPTSPDPNVPAFPISRTTLTSVIESGGPWTQWWSPQNALEFLMYGDDLHGAVEVCMAAGVWHQAFILAWVYLDEDSATQVLGFQLEHALARDSVSDTLALFHFLVTSGVHPSPLQVRAVRHYLLHLQYAVYTLPVQPTSALLSQSPDAVHAQVDDTAAVPSQFHQAPELSRELNAQQAVVDLSSRILAVLGVNFHPPPGSGVSSTLEGALGSYGALVSYKRAAASGSAGAMPTFEGGQIEALQVLRYTLRSLWYVHVRSALAEALASGEDASKVAAVAWALHLQCFVEIHPRGALLDVALSCVQTAMSRGLPPSAAMDVLGDLAVSKITGPYRVRWNNMVQELDAGAAVSAATSRIASGRTAAKEAESAWVTLHKDRGSLSEDEPWMGDEALGLVWDFELSEEYLEWVSGGPDVWVAKSKPWTTSPEYLEPGTLPSWPQGSTIGSAVEHAKIDAAGRSADLASLQQELHGANLVSVLPSLLRTLRAAPPVPEGVDGSPSLRTSANSPLRALDKSPAGPKWVATSSAGSRTSPRSSPVPLSGGRRRSNSAPSSRTAGSSGGLPPKSPKLSSQPAGGVREPSPVAVADNVSEGTRVRRERKAARRDERLALAEEPPRAPVVRRRSVGSASSAGPSSSGGKDSDSSGQEATRRTRTLSGSTRKRRKRRVPREERQSSSGVSADDPNYLNAEYFDLQTTPAPAEGPRRRASRMANAMDEEEVAPDPPFPLLRSGVVDAARPPSGAAVEAASYAPPTPIQPQQLFSGPVGAEPRLLSLDGGVTAAEPALSSDPAALGFLPEMNESVRGNRSMMYRVEQETVDPQFLISGARHGSGRAETAPLAPATPVAAPTPASAVTSPTAIQMEEAATSPPSFARGPEVVSGGVQTSLEAIEVVIDDEEEKEKEKPPVQVESPAVVPVPEAVPEPAPQPPPAQPPLAPPGPPATGEIPIPWTGGLPPDVFLSMDFGGGREEKSSWLSLADLTSPPPLDTAGPVFHGLRPLGPPGSGDGFQARLASLDEALNLVEVTASRLEREFSLSRAAVAQVEEVIPIVQVEARPESPKATEAEPETGTSALKKVHTEEEEAKKETEKEVKAKRVMDDNLEQRLEEALTLYGARVPGTEFESLSSSDDQDGTPLRFVPRLTSSGRSQMRRAEDGGIAAADDALAIADAVLKASTGKGGRGRGGGGRGHGEDDDDGDVLDWDLVEAILNDDNI